MKKNVAIISGKLEAGGAERAVSNLSIVLSEFYNVFLIVFSGGVITYPYKGKLIDLHEPRHYGSLQKIPLLLHRITMTRKLKKQYDIECSISFGEIPNVVNCLTKGKDKVITSYRNYMSIYRRDRLEHFLTKFVDMKSDKIVALSKGVQKDLVNEFSVSEANIVTIYNSCDPQLLLRLSMETNYEMPSYEYIVTVGRLTKQKGFWHLIRAFSLIHKKLPQLHLVIIGEGELRDAFIKQTKALNIDEYVHFLGYLKNPHEYYRNARAFIFSSLYEGLGNAILEALACGVPVVSTDCLAGPKEILSEISDESQITQHTEKILFSEYGILVPPFPMSEPDFRNMYPSNEEKMLAEAVITLLSDARMTEKYKRAAAERIRYFSPENINKQWIGLIESP